MKATTNKNKQTTAKNVILICGKSELSRHANVRAAMRKIRSIKREMKQGIIEVVHAIDGFICAVILGEKSKPSPRPVQTPIRAASEKRFINPAMLEGMMQYRNLRKL